MQIAITGSSGLVGTALIAAAQEAGHEIRRLVRSQPQDDDILWKPSTGEIAAEQLEGLDSVVHLAGEGIADGRWNAAKKERIRASRVEGTGLISNTLAQLDRKPHTLVCASAIGYYGDRGEETCDETSPPGEGFLPEVCQAWEQASQPAVEAGIRVVNVRIGIVLSTKGGALAKMLLPFKFGLAGNLGSGRQYMSWITLDELVRVICFCLSNEALRGPVNAVAPGAVTNSEYTKTLGRVLTRPTILPMPAFAARLAFGEMADALLLASTRVAPAVLQQQQYEFQFPVLEDALRHVIKDGI